MRHTFKQYAIIGNSPLPRIIGHHSILDAIIKHNNSVILVDVEQNMLDEHELLFEKTYFPKPDFRKCVPVYREKEIKTDGDILKELKITTFFDLEKEYIRIKNKNSELSATNREFIKRIYKTIIK